ncbi:hypothetical protein [Jongsikchunia kroppenstedtii]|uniref:hypothetical protein n=1 Tax=Jongsikchunia kroppenstedtii TaxID=1121721 RepID=UPI000373EB38|nr:hypothetical protein [Jongsikchunia kroppenstedtii]
MSASLREARVELAARQELYVRHLLAGTLPPDIERESLRARGFRQSGRILASKRADGAADVCPDLRDLPDWRNFFHDYAVENRKDGCSHDDMRAFRGWLRAQPNPTPATIGWLAAEDVFAGERRAAQVTHRGRSELVLGIGRRVVWVTLGRWTG